MDDLSVCRSVRTRIGRSVCPVHCGKTADRIRMPFGVIYRTGSGMRQVVGFGDWSTERGTFAANLGRAIVTNGTLRVCVPQRRDAALFPNYFGQTCCLFELSSEANCRPPTNARVTLWHRFCGLISLNRHFCVPEAKSDFPASRC